MEGTDEKLVAKYLAGDEDAFATLVQRHLKGVYSFAARSTGNDAEDIVQDTFLKAWKNLRKYDPGRARFKTWLMHIARNTIIDFVHKKRPFVFSDLNSEQDDLPVFDSTDPEPLPDEIIARMHDARDIQEVLKKLSTNYREILLLRYMSQMTFEEISKILEEPLNTVKSRHHRGLIQLRQYLEAMHQKGK